MQFRCFLAFLCWAFSAGSVHADIWGFIDEKGVGHFSATKVDERYELFSREAAPAPDTTASPLGADPHDLPHLPPKLAKFFESSSTLKAVRPHMQAAAKQHHLDIELLQALIASESGFNLTAVSPKGALGLMQLMPATATRYGIHADKKPYGALTQQQKLFDAQTNISTGSRYLRDLLNLFNGKLDLALAAYNAGEGAVQRAGNKIPHYPETQNYVRTVMQIYTALKPTISQPASVLTSEPKRPANPDPLRPIRGRGNGLPTSLHNDRGALNFKDFS